DGDEAAEQHPDPADVWPDAKRHTQFQNAIGDEQGRDQHRQRDDAAERKPRQSPAEQACRMMAAPERTKIQPSATLVAIVDNKGKAMAAKPASTSTQP